MNKIIVLNNETLTMSSREIAELLDFKLEKILLKTELFEQLQTGNLSLSSASHLAFCLNKEIQNNITHIYDTALTLGANGHLSKSREMSTSISLLKQITASAEIWFSHYPTLSRAFNVLRKILFEVDCGLIMMTSPIPRRKQNNISYQHSVVLN